MTSLQQILQSLNREELFFVVLATTFFAIGVGFVVFIFVSRLVKNARERETEKFKTAFQLAINTLIFDTDDNAPAPAISFILEELMKAVKRNQLAKQVLVNQLVSMRKNLSGATAKVLDKAYIDLGLHQFSINKLSSGAWYIQAEGIRELAEMNYPEAVQFSKAMLKSKNKTLKEEMFMASIRLNKENPLAFLDHYDGEITLWMRINIHHHLALMDARKLPDFSHWFNNPREDVVLFCISMARHFRQTAAVPAMVGLLNHPSKTIMASVIRALGELEAFGTIDKVVALSDRNWQDSKISNCIVLFIALSCNFCTKNNSC